MNLHDLTAFVAVAETGSVVKAAKRLNLTQPATTRRIQNFESSLAGVRLFNRSVKPATLTASGVLILEHCRKVLVAVAELKACGTDEKRPAGLLKTGIAHGLEEMALTQPLDSVRRAFPDVRLQITSDWSGNLIEQVRNGSIDIGIGLLTDTHVLPPSLSGRPLGTEQIVVVAPLSSEFKKERSVWKLSDLSSRRWILNPVGCGCRAMLTAAFANLQHPLDVAAEVFGEKLQLALIARSGGLGLVPRRQLENSPYRKKLRILRIKDFQLSGTITLLKTSVPSRFDPVIASIANAVAARLTHDN